MIALRSTGLLTFGDSRGTYFQEAMEAMKAVDDKVEAMGVNTLRAGYPMMSFTDETTRGYFDSEAGVLIADACLKAVQVRQESLHYLFEG